MEKQPEQKEEYENPERIAEMAPFIKRIKKAYEQIGYLKFYGMVCELSVLRGTKGTPTQYALEHLLSGSSSWRFPEATPEIDAPDKIYEQFINDPAGTIEALKSEK